MGVHYSAIIRPSARSARRSQRKRRQAATVLEVILALPILVIALLAIIEFGVLYSNLQQIAFASRVGALEASQTANLQAATEVPPGVISVVERQLGGASMSACRIRLEHNDGGVPVELLYPAVGICACGPNSFLAPPPPGEYVRLTVCVNLTLVTPNLLASFGLDLSGQTAEQSTVLRYEL